MSEEKKTYIVIVPNYNNKYSIAIKLSEEQAKAINWRFDYGNRND